MSDDSKHSNMFVRETHEMLPQNCAGMWNALSWSMTVHHTAQASRFHENDHYLGLVAYEQENDRWTLEANAHMPVAGESPRYVATDLTRTSAKHLFCAFSEEHLRYQNYSTCISAPAEYLTGLIHEIEASKKCGAEPFIAVTAQLFLPNFDPSSPEADYVIDQHFKGLPYNRDGLMRDLDELAINGNIDNDLHAKLSDLKPTTQFYIVHHPLQISLSSREIWRVGPKGEQEHLATCHNYAAARQMTAILESGYLTQAYQEDAQQQFTKYNYVMHYNNHWGRKPGHRFALLGN
jgi:hypothetical protein